MNAVNLKPIHPLLKRRKCRLNVRKLPGSNHFMVILYNVMMAKEEDDHTVGTVFLGARKQHHIYDVMLLIGIINHPLRPEMLSRYAS